jgi:hypothetical protein
MAESETRAGIEPGIEQKLKALDGFKDWSNYLLVTTVAALGWTTAKDGAGFSSIWIKGVCIALFALSVLFAILTLALIPHIAEELSAQDCSIYRVRWRGWFGSRFELADFCLPQHVLFLLGIIVYGGGAAFSTECESWLAILVTVGVVSLGLWLKALATKKRADHFPGDSSST